jgi:hypothetical protein
MSRQIPKIEVIDELNRFMIQHQFKNIEDVKKRPFEELLKMDGFGWRILYFLSNNSI